MKLRSTLAAVMAALSVSAADAAEVHFKAGETITFRSPYKTGCATIELADAVSRIAEEGPRATRGMDVQRCYKLIPDKPYRIAEVQQYNGKDFYRIPLSNGDLTWTYVIGSKEVYESVRPGLRVVMHTPNYACANIDTMILVDSTLDPITRADLVGRHRGLVNDACDNLPTAVEFEVQQVMVSDNNWYRFACVAKYEPDVPFGPDRRCVWRRLE